MEEANSEPMRFKPSAGQMVTLLLSWMMLGASGPPLASQNNPIFAFYELAPGLYRGGQPTEEGYRRLKELGVRTILNFRHEKDQIEWDRKQAQKWGMRYVSLPWTIYGDSEPEILEDFFRTLEDPSSRPLFMHCRRGTERTGVMSALYYMKYEGLSAEEAYRKATEGFPVRWFWKPFVRKRFNALKRYVAQN